MNSETTIPNSPSELIQNNTQVTPEEIWERIITLSPTDLQVMSWNIVNRLHQLHTMVVREKMEKGDDDNTLPLWVKDSTLLSVCKESLSNLCEN